MIKRRFVVLDSRSNSATPHKKSRMHKLIKELRRREVFKTVGLYVGISWITIEASSVMLPAFGAPDWTLRAIIILAVIGLPITVVLAWIYDITEGGVQVQDETDDGPVVPFGGRRTDFVVIGVLTAALGFSIYLNLTSGPGIDSNRRFREPDRGCHVRRIVGAGFDHRCRGGTEYHGIPKKRCAGGL